jgi:hypothetical protein
MIYLACPYSHADLGVREHRFREACRATAALIRAGHVVFCPVVHFHALVDYGLPTDWQSWERIDREFLRRCDEVVLLKPDGWEQSEGVRAEDRVAQEFGLPVSTLAGGRNPSSALFPVSDGP